MHSFSYENGISIYCRGNIVIETKVRLRKEQIILYINFRRYHLFGNLLGKDLPLWDFYVKISIIKYRRHCEVLILKFQIEDLNICILSWFFWTSNSFVKHDRVLIPFMISQVQWFRIILRGFLFNNCVRSCRGLRIKFTILKLLKRLVII